MAFSCSPRAAQMGNRAVVAGGSSSEQQTGEGMQGTQEALVVPEHPPGFSECVQVGAQRQGLASGFCSETHHAV